MPPRQSSPWQGPDIFSQKRVDWTRKTIDLELDDEAFPDGQIELLDVILFLVVGVDRTPHHPKVLEFSAVDGLELNQFHAGILHFGCARLNSSKEDGFHFVALEFPGQNQGEIFFTRSFIPSALWDANEVYPGVH